MASKRALVLFFKNPVAGKVKTRLAATVGHVKALEIYISLLKHARRTARAVQADRFVYYSDFIDLEDEWTEPAFHKRLQRGADLGLRMHHALEEVLAGSEKAVLVGGDIPGLSPGIIEAAFVALDEAPVVFGPAADGGYYLVGLRQPQPALFTGMQWSTSQVLEETLARCRRAALDYRLIDTLCDVDTEEDWRKAGIVL